jgi:hypothetical protein
MSQKNGVKQKYLLIFLVLPTQTQFHQLIFLKSQCCCGQKILFNLELLWMFVFNSLWPCETKA